MSQLSTPTDGDRGPLETLREVPQYHWLGLVAACLIGLAAASLHWLGLVLGGALVGLLSADTKRALLGGVGFGVLVVVVWLGVLWVAGSAGGALAMDELSLLPVGIALGLPALGSLLRGVV